MTNVIWADEKYFCLNQKQQKQNDGLLSRENSHEIVENNTRNDEKVMIFVASVDGKAPIVHAFVDKNDRSVTVNSTCYFELLNEVVWLTFRSSATR